LAITTAARPDNYCEGRAKCATIEKGMSRSPADKQHCDGTARLRRGLAVAAVLAGACATAACADEKSKTDLLGEPKIMQVFVADPAESTDPDFSGLTLTYGVHPDINICTFDKTCTDDGTDLGMPIAGLHCDTTAGSPTLGHCVDGKNAQPIARQATILHGASMIYVVVGELLDGRTLEEFACQCQEDPAHPGAYANLDPAHCGTDTAWAKDPSDCSGCGGTGAARGQCERFNGAPSATALLPGIGQVTCGALLQGAGGLTQLRDGYYYPSGNQFISVGGTGWAGLGPAIVLQPSFDLPADSDCTVTLSDTVKDWQGRGLEKPTGAITFHTEPVVATVGGTVPADGDTGVPDRAEIDVNFNTDLDPATVTPASVVVMPAVPNLAAPMVMGTTIVLGPKTGDTLGLKPMTAYTVTVKGTVADTYGRTLGADFTETFTTE
jgi:hypothetical protein